MIINLTPHALNLYNEAKQLVATVPPSGVVARVSVKRALVGERDGVPLYETVYGQVQDLPEPAGNDIYVVSGMVRAAFDRFDLYQPGELVRNEAGAVIGAIGLSQ